MSLQSFPPWEQTSAFSMEHWWEHKDAAEIYLMADNVLDEDREHSCILSAVFLFSLHKCMKAQFIVLVLCQGRKKLMVLTFSGLGP